MAKNCFICYKEVLNKDVVEINSNGIIYPACSDCATDKVSNDRALNKSDTLVLIK